MSQEVDSRVVEMRFDNANFEKNTKQTISTIDRLMEKLQFKGAEKGFEKLEELAALLGGGVGATRSAVDAGWISYPHQIGQTGITVRPRLYLAFGVSGLVQHTVGMSSSGVVVAVNKDRNAPIFACADYGIVADWEETIGEWIQYVKERKQQS